MGIAGNKIIGRKRGINPNAPNMYKTYLTFSWLVTISNKTE